MTITQDDIDAACLALEQACLDGASAERRSQLAVGLHQLMVTRAWQSVARDRAARSARSDAERPACP